MRAILRMTSLTACLLALPASAALAAPGTGGSTAPFDATPTLRKSAPAHVAPRVALSYRRFSVGNLDGSALWLDGAQLDVYALSRRWFRLGLEAEGGAGKGSLMGYSASLEYGLVGVTAGVQYPARVTPFVEGRFVGGVLGGQLDGSIAVPGGTISHAQTATVLYGGGVDAGLALYTVGRAYVSGSVGWVHSTWLGIDYAGFMANPSGGMHEKDITADSFTFKLGVGL